MDFFEGVLWALFMEAVLLFVCIGVYLMWFD